MASAYLIIQLAWTKKYWFVCLVVGSIVYVWYEFGFEIFWEPEKTWKTGGYIAHTNHTTDINITYYDTTLAHINILG